MIPLRVLICQTRNVLPQRLKTLWDDLQFQRRAERAVESALNAKAPRRQTHGGIADANDKELDGVDARSDGQHTQ